MFLPIKKTIQKILSLIDKSLHEPKKNLGHTFCVKICPMHLSSLPLTRPVMNLTYPIQNHAICSSINLIYFLICTHCDAFYMGETENILSTRMIGDRFSYNNPKIYPFRLKPHHISPMYVYFISYSPTPNTSPTTILNLPIN